MLKNPNYPPEIQNPFMKPRYYKTVRFEHFRTFSEVARRGGYAEAGRVLGLSRPTVWQQIDSLEAAFDVRLFSRTGRRMELTPAGRLLIDLVQPSVAAMEGIVETFRSLLAGVDPVLRLAGIPGNDLLFRAIARFHKTWPGTRVTWIEQRGSDVIRLIQGGECDLGLVLSVPDADDDARLHYEDCGRRPFSLIAPCDHPLIRKRSVTLEDLTQYPLVTFPKDNPFRNYLDHAFSRAGVFPQVRIGAEAETIATAEECVQLGLGLALVLPSCTHVAPRRLKIRPLHNQLGYAPLHLVRKRGAHLSPQMSAFVSVIRDLL